MTLSPTSSRGSSGAAPTFDVVRFPITFDTPGLVPESFPITAVDLGVYPITSLVLGDSGNGSFTVAGDHTAAFPVDGTFTVSGSTGNDGPYTVESSSFAAGHTTIEVPEFFYDATPDGSIDVGQQTITVAGDRTAAFAPGVAFFAIRDDDDSSPSSVVTATFAGGATVVAGVGSFLVDGFAYVSAVVAVGAVVYTPAIGDMLIGNNLSPVTLVTVSEAWNGTAPNLRVLTEAYRQAQAPSFLTFDVTVADAPPVVPALLLSAFPGFAFGSTWRLWRFTTADPILVTVDDNNGLDPGSTQGAAEVVMLVVPA